MMLSEKQEEIASFEKGALLVLASAGSGKTRVLTERIRRLIQKTKRQILAITFTNKASEEIKERLKDISNLEERAYIGTFHSFCCSIIEKHGNVIGYNTIPHIFSNDEDRLKLIEDIFKQIPSVWKKYIVKNSKEKTAFKRRALDFVSAIKKEVILDEELQEKGLNKDDILIYFNYRDTMKSLNAIDFDDLLFLAYKIFMANPNIASLYRRNFEYICIDEAQDMNKAQYVFLRALSGENKNVMLVGDPKQSIYGFNGSSSDYMLVLFKKDYSPAEIELKENYRSAKKILEYANRIMPNSTDVFNVVIDGVCKIEEFSNPEKEALAVVNKIFELMNNNCLDEFNGPLTPNDITIIARNKYILFEIEKLLKETSISYYYKNTIRGLVLESTSGKIFDLALQVQINEKDMLHLEELSKLLGIDSVVTLKSAREICINELNTMILDNVICLKEDGNNFKKSINNIKKYIESKKDCTELDLDELNLAYSDFNALLEYWQKYSTQTIDTSLSQFHNSLVLGQVISLEEKDGIALSTVHTMKGQESDVVFLVGMDDMTFPDYRAVQKGGIELQQEKNDLYVAVTRAKRHLYISYPAYRTMPWGCISPRKKSRLLP